MHIILLLPFVRFFPALVEKNELFYNKMSYQLKMNVNSFVIRSTYNLKKYISLPENEK